MTLTSYMISLNSMLDEMLGDKNQNATPGISEEPSQIQTISHIGNTLACSLISAYFIS